MDQTALARSYPTSTTARCGKERKAQGPEKDRTKQQKTCKRKEERGKRKRKRTRGRCHQAAGHSWAAVRLEAERRHRPVA
eukprot:363866-Chlamydomonas_euryale.AAC.4